MPLDDTLPPAIRSFVEAMNRFDTQGLLESFTEDAFVNDISREFWGKSKIKPFLDKEIVGDRVTMAVSEVRQHYGLTIVTALMDGTYDKTHLPPQLFLTFYFGLQGDRIASLIILHNKPSPY
jgi:hypothetical protein